MSTHNICFRREIRKIICGYPLLSVAMYHIVLKWLVHVIQSYTCIQGFIFMENENYSNSCIKKMLYIKILFSCHQQLIHVYMYW